jgi:hypothetical protein
LQRLALISHQYYIYFNDRIAHKTAVGGCGAVVVVVLVVLVQVDCFITV